MCGVGSGTSIDYVQVRMISLLNGWLSQGQPGCVAVAVKRRLGLFIL